MPEPVNKSVTLDYITAK